MFISTNFKLKTTTTTNIMKHKQTLEVFLSEKKGR